MTLTIFSKSTVIQKYILVPICVCIAIIFIGSAEAGTGNIDGIGEVNLSDAILALQICAAVPATTTVYTSEDIDGDGVIGIENAIYALQIISNTKIGPNIDNDFDGYTENQGDCDDYNSSIRPGIDEICNGIDDNCNSKIDENLLKSFYKDSDNDGFGNNNEMIITCRSFPRYVLDNSDCNDNNNNVYPGAQEICGDNIDQDCNGSDISCSSVLIASYLSITHDQEFSSFDEDLEAIVRELSASGKALSGVHVTRYIDNAQYHINNFVNTALAHVNQVASNNTLNGAEILDIFELHRESGLLFYMEYTEEHIGRLFAPNLVDYSKNEIESYLNDIYDLAAIQIIQLL